MALKGVLWSADIQIRLTELDEALRHYVERVGLHFVSHESDGRAYLRPWDDFDGHSVVPRQADFSRMNRVAFEVASKADLNSMAKRMVKAASPWITSWSSQHSSQLFKVAENV